MIKRATRHTPNRTRLTVQQQPPGVAVTCVLTISATKLLITTNVPVVLRAIPLGITRQAAGSGPQLLPTAASQTSATTILITYAASLVTTDVVTIPSNVQEIRGQAGGFLAPQVKTF